MGRLNCGEDGTGRLIIRRSKTDTHGEGVVVFVSAAAMQSLEFIRDDAADGDSVFGLCRNQISRRIKQAARTAGLGDASAGTPLVWGWHATLREPGTELPRLMTAGRWRSPRMPALYTRNETVARGAVAQYYGSQDVGLVGNLCGNAGGLQEVSMHRKGFGNELSEEWIDHTLTIHDKMPCTLNSIELYGKLGVEPRAKSPITAIMDTLLVGPSRLPITTCL